MGATTPQRIAQKYVTIAAIVSVAAGIVTPGVLRAAEPLHQPSAAELRTRALDLAYNLDYDEALGLLRTAVEQAPEDPAVHNSLATVLWLRLLFSRGAVTVDHYLGAFSRRQIDLGKPPAEVDAEFRRHVARARDLAEKQRDAARRDPVAQYNLGVALGLDASYTATVEGRMLAGFRAARRSFDLHETVLSRHPGRVEAGLIVGMYRYIVSTLSLPMRAMAWLVGFSGGRDEGIALVEAAARSRTDARADALFALVLIYNREARYDEALAALGELRKLYPRNRLLLLEAGATAHRAGRLEEADSLLNEGLARLAKDTRVRIPGELALWHYKRGAARAEAGRTGAALEDLRLAAGPDALPWVGGRARVELGRLALARGDRAAARGYAAEAAAMCARGNDPLCENAARTLQRTSNGR
jgi:hypothetical protein